MKPSICLFYRKQRKNAFSIEELFQSIYKVLNATDSSMREVNLPLSGASFFTVLKNIYFAKSNKGYVNHITGEVNYISLGLGKRTILTIHDVHSAFKSGGVKSFVIKVLWFYLPSLFVKKITVISEFSKQELISILPWAKDKMVVIYNPLNPLALNPEPREKIIEATINDVPRVLIVGTKPNKNLERTLEALLDKKVEVTIIGKLTKDQLSLAESLKYTIRNKTDLSYKEVVNEYIRTDLVCFASLYEGFGMPIIEAQSIGKPVITSNYGAMKEISGNAALLVNPESTIEIGEAVLRLIENRELRTEMIINGFENIKRFDMKTISKKYLDLYKEVRDA